MREESVLSAGSFLLGKSIHGLHINLFFLFLQHENTNH